MMTRRIIHVDMDAFYASVEQRDNPSIRNRPVVVGADPDEGRGRGVVSAASYEARSFGIHSAMPISQAYRRCPDAVFLPVNMKKYREVSRGIMAVFLDYTPLVEAVSLDEAFLDVSDAKRLFSGAELIGRKIKTRILEEHDLTASVGVAPNKLLAKMASEFDKPDGFTVIDETHVVAFLDPLPVTALWGVGKKTEERLASMGINRIEQLRKIPGKHLVSMFGKGGEQLYHYSRGIDSSAVLAESKVKSISNEITFRHDETRHGEIQQTILHLSEKVGYRLRKKHFTARTVAVKLRFSDFETKVKAKTLTRPTIHSEDIYAAALTIYQSMNLQFRAIRLIGVGVSHLSEGKGNQTSLFEGEETERESLTAALDALKRRFGEKAIGRGPRY